MSSDPYTRNCNDRLAEVSVKMQSNIPDTATDYPQNSEATPKAKAFGWVKWVVLAACLAIAALIAIPSVMNPKTQAEDKPEPTSEAEPEPETDFETDPFGELFLPLPEEPTLTDAAKAGIKDSIGPNDSYRVVRVSEDEFDKVTLGLPIASYILRCDESGTYYWDVGESSQLYPVYVEGELDCLVLWSEVLGLEYVYDYDSDANPDPDTYLELFNRLKAGTNGSMAMVLAADGTYIFDGTSFERVSDFCMTNVYPSEDYAPLADADLPDELIAELRLTDTSVTEPLL